jgi:predicted Zn finger-like uncharacterized protein
MSVTVTCPQCGLERGVPEEAIGARARCPSCRTVFRLGGEDPAAAPGPPAVRAVRCPACRKRFGVPGGTPDGSEVGCPHCATVAELTPGGARPPAAAIADPFAAAPADPPAFDDGDDPGDFVAFLNAQRTTRPAPTPEFPSASASRYGAAPAGPTVEADCVLRPFDCPEDASIGQMITARLQEMLQKEGLFDKVVVSDSPNAWGRVVTVVDRDTTAIVNPGSFFRYGSVSLRVEAALHPAQGEPEPIAVEAHQPGQKGMSAKAMLKAAVKASATKVGQQVALKFGGYKHLRAEINGYATAACVFGVLGLLPGIGLILYAIGLIPAVVVLVYNRGRPEKAGMRRTWTGLILGGLASLAWAYFLFIAANR